MITREDFKNKYCNIAENTARFTIEVDYQRANVNALNDTLEEAVDYGNLLCDIGYQPIALKGTNLIIEVFVGDISTWIEEGF